MSKKLMLLVFAVMVATVPVARAAVFITEVAHRNTDADAPEDPQIAPNPLDEDEPCFVDRTHQYNEIPEYLIGADYVMLANDNKNVSAYELDITLADNATLYVFVDNRMGGAAGGLGVDPDISGMPWLDNMGFVDTGDDIGIDESADGDIDQYSSVFSLAVSAGTITINGCTEGHGGNMLGVAALGPKVKGHSPAPADGAVYEDTWVLLTWVGGDFAASHDVYFGESLDEVSAATREDPNVFLGTVSTEMLRIGTAGDLYSEPLVPGQTYYWRVDEVNDLNPESPWKGNVWSFRVRPLIAYDPSPADGASYVLLDPDLAWTPGMGTLFHTVFFGESYEDVDAMMVGWMTAAATIAPASVQLYGPLQPETTYYWRVDEFAVTGTTNKGEVWSFTTVPEITVTDPDLIGWWTFDEGQGTTAVDWSGNGNHGTLAGDPQWVSGYFGDALAFDGSGDYVNCGHGPTLNIRDEITVACWIKVAAFTRTWETILAKGDNSYRMSRGPGNGDSIHFGCNGTSGGNLNATTIVTDDKWHHVALVYDGTDKIVYIDGVEDARLASTGQIAESNYELYIGANSQQAGRFLEGLVDDVRIYSRALAENEIQVLMRGNPLLAAFPEPGPGAIVDVRDATFLRWQAGETAASHDVYFGTEKAAVASADKDAAEYQGNQAAISFSLAGMVELGGGDYYWRIDEVEADGTVQTGYVWKFMIPDYLVVEDFESYSNEVGSRVFEKWIDGIGFTQPEPGHPGNNTGSAVGHDIWSVDSPYFEGTIMETANVYGGGQAMPIYYDNTVAPAVSEADRTFTPGQNWTVEGVTTLVVHFRGEADNTGDLYVKINGVKVPYDGDPADIASTKWIAWEIDLASVGVSLTNITTLTLGIEGGQTGVLFFDDIQLTKP